MFRMTKDRAWSIIREARAAYKANSQIKFGLAQVKRFTRAALTVLPSKELDPRYYLTRADTGNDILTGNPKIEGSDVRFCPKGLFEGVLGVERINGIVFGGITDFDAVRYLHNLESVAFNVSKRDFRESLPAYRKRVYQEVLAKA